MGCWQRRAAGRRRLVGGPGSDQFIRSIVADVYAEHPMLEPTLPLLQSAADAIIAQIGQANEVPAFLAAKQVANAGDGRLDKVHRIRKMATLEPGLWPAWWVGRPRAVSFK